MIRHICDNCGADITGQRIYSVEVQCQEGNLSPYIVYRYIDVCGPCIASVTAALREWNGPRE